MAELDIADQHRALERVPKGTENPPTHRMRLPRRGLADRTIPPGGRRP